MNSSYHSSIPLGFLLPRDHNSVTKLGNTNKSNTDGSCSGTVTTNRNRQIQHIQENVLISQETRNGRPQPNTISPSSAKITGPVTEAAGARAERDGPRFSRRSPTRCGCGAPRGASSSRAGGQINCSRRWGCSGTRRGRKNSLRQLRDGQPRLRSVQTNLAAGRARSDRSVCRNTSTQSHPGGADASLGN